MLKDLSQKLAQLPQKPGVYTFKDSRGEVLYVGKAVNLKHRVNSYFHTPDDGRGLRIANMIAQIADLDFTVTDNEHESLILENNYIKELKPKYNILLRDDKNYQFLKINLHDEIPTIEFERKITDRTARYFGPYTSGLAIKDTLRLIRRIFPYCANHKVGSKPCFYYHIGKCPGVCFGKISLPDYREYYVKKIIQFLDGRQTEILSDLQTSMKTEAKKGRFERAAKLRDQIFALNRILERQKIIYPKKVSQDIFALYQDGASCINLFLIREGKLIRKENFILDHTKQVEPQEILEEFLPRYYSESQDRPKEVVLPVKIPNNSELKFKILTPTKGHAFELLKLGAENAKQYLESLGDKHLLEEAKLMSALKELQRVLNLDKLPARIEAFDISNIQGTNAVGSMVVFDFARPKKSDYRKFKIKTKSTPDDFAMMRETLIRRFAKTPDAKWPRPDLVLIDGGKGQLSIAVEVLKHYNLTIPLIGLAKRLEEIFTPGKKLALTLPVNSIALFLLLRIRDEAHRFGITYHRKLRLRKSLTSVIDEIPGIGPQKKKLLLQTFGSVSKIRHASLTELAQIVGRKASEQIKAQL